jgi:putative transposase
MKKTKFTEAQIVFALRQADTGIAVSEVCRKMGISEATFYNWKKKFGGLGVCELRRLQQLGEENQQLKKLVADLSLDNKCCRMYGPDAKATSQVQKSSKANSSERVGQ